MLAGDVRRGDTLIEVLLAITVFSLIAVAAITIMNQSVNAGQRSIEITLVRQQIDTQVEALRAAHQAYAAMTNGDQRDESVWHQLVMVSEDEVDTSAGCPTNLAAFHDTFVLNPGTAAVSKDLKPMSDENAPIYAQIRTSDDGNATTSYGMWIEKRQVATVGSDAEIPKAYDFRIRACWPGAGTGRVPMQLETVVRLYDIS